MIDTCWPPPAISASRDATSKIHSRASSSRASKLYAIRTVRLALAGNDNIDRSMLTRFWAFADTYDYKGAGIPISRFHPNAPADFPPITAK
jgi:hypothetical protein